MTAAFLLIGTALLPAQPQPDVPQPDVPQPVLETQADLAYQIGEELRCPVCQGMPIAESPATMAQDMMKQVRQLVAAGKSRNEVLSYFEARYGEWVLLRPKARGVNLLVWLLPPFGLLLGLFVIWRWLHGAAGVQDGSREPHADPHPPSDPFLRAVREEVDR